MPFPLKRSKAQANSPKQRGSRGALRNGVPSKTNSRHPLLNGATSVGDDMMYEGSEYYIPSLDVEGIDRDDEDHNSVGSASTLTANSSSSSHPHPDFHIHQNKNNNGNISNGFLHQSGGRKRTHSDKRDEISLDSSRYPPHLIPICNSNIPSVPHSPYTPIRNPHTNHSIISEGSSAPPRPAPSSTPSKNKRSGRPPLASNGTNTQPNEGTIPNMSSDNLPRPSEALFIQSLVDHCKRIAPLWFSGVSQLREKNREENRRVNIGSCLSSCDQWDAIAAQIHSMDSTSETESVVNLLKKLYKELHTDSVLWFIKCWLQMPETRVDNRCAFSRGDAKSRMRRIDGGRGSDKVWRLDTLVAMLYHGLPLSSTDTHLLQHTCGQELCVRPQHLRFRANAVALVIVLKALQQAGYRVLPPTWNGEKESSEGSVKKDAAGHSNGVAAKRKRNERSAEEDNSGDLSHLDVCEDFFNQREDDCVDISGPFTIQEIQQFRKEELHSCSVYLQKYTLSAVDEDIIQRCPLLRAHLENNRRTFVASDEKNSPEAKRVSQNVVKPPQTPRPAVRNYSSRVNHHQDTNLNPLSNMSVPVVSTGKERNVSSGSNAAAADAVAISALMSLSNSITSSNVDRHESDQLHVPCNSTTNSHFSISSNLLPTTSSCSYTNNHPSAFTPIALQPPVTMTPLSSTGHLNSVALGGSHNTQPGRITPRQPAKKRLEARTPTFELDGNLSSALPPHSSFSAIHSNGELKASPYIKCEINAPTTVAEEDQELAEIMSADERISEVGTSNGTSPLGSQNIPSSEGYHRRNPNMTHNSMLAYHRTVGANISHTDAAASWSSTRAHLTEPLSEPVPPANSLMNRGIMTPDVVNILSSLRNPLDSSHSINNDFYSILSSLSRVTPSPQLTYMSLASTIGNSSYDSVDSVAGLSLASASSISHHNSSSSSSIMADTLTSGNIHGSNVLKSEH